QERHHIAARTIVARSAHGEPHSLVRSLWGTGSLRPLPRPRSAKGLCFGSGRGAGAGRRSELKTSFSRARRSGLAIVRLARALDRGSVLLRPRRERRHRLEESPPEGREPVVHARRDRREYGARDEPIALEAAERERQHSLRDAFDRALERGETRRA